jgi:hypothetical protein
MKASQRTEPHNQIEDAQPRHASFILRCQTSAGGRLRARLVDVRSGVSCSIGDLDELPDIVRGLLSQASPAEDEP